VQQGCRPAAARVQGGAWNAICTPAARGLYMGGHGLAQQLVGTGSGWQDFTSGAAAQLLASCIYVPRDIVRTLTTSTQLLSKKFTIIMYKVSSTLHCCT
jgi:hypothetical protein